MAVRLQVTPFRNAARLVVLVALAATAVAGSTCGPRHIGTECDQCHPDYSGRDNNGNPIPGGSYPVCAPRGCNDILDCNYHGIASGYFGSCTCLCAYNYAGPSCGECHPNYAVGGYPACLERACDARDCNNVPGAIATGVIGFCECVCPAPFAGIWCQQCHPNFPTGGYPTCGAA